MLAPLRLTQTRTVHKKKKGAKASFVGLSLVRHVGTGKVSWRKRGTQGADGRFASLRDHVGRRTYRTDNLARLKQLVRVHQ